MNMPVVCPTAATPAPLSGLGRPLPSDLGAEVRAIIEQGRLSILFQPIVAVGGNTIHGYEALTRGPSDSALHAPGSLFDAACQAGLLLELEQQCWRLAHDRFIELGLPGRLFLNTSSRSLIQPGQPLLRALRGTDNPDLRPERVVIEITEQYPIDDFAAVVQAASDYRVHGFQLAIDDLGAGYSGLRLWSELRPDYVKIDSHFLQRVHEDPIKQEFIRSIRDIALGTKSHVVAEGIETAGEYQALLQLGISLGQGYYFSRPKNRPPRELAQEPMEMEKRNKSPHQRLSETIGTLAVSVPTVTPDTTVDEAVTLLQQHPDLHTLPLLVDNRPIGAVRRQRLMELYLKRYARELYGRRPVTRFMDHHPLIVEHDLPVERVSQKITNQINFEIEHQFIITRNGEYLGIGLVRDLLKKITDLQIRNARYANPLTLLPGNVPIYEHIDHLLEEQQEFTVCYCDLDHFKPYNDSYGYSRGDEVIRTLAQILTAHIDEQRDFAGHIGGDDFILIFTSPDWRERCEHILRHFERECRQFYNDADLAQGGIWGHDRQGNNVFFPLLSLSIGAVSPNPQQCHSHHQVATLATDAKRQAKKQPGNSLFVERRRAPLTSF
ncbi:MAG: bifunctional diguanylate cyclase/phosphodiesterase [Thiohalomonadaceae bacterium]